MCTYSYLIPLPPYCCSCCQTLHGTMDWCIRRRRIRDHPPLLRVLFLLLRAGQHTAGEAIRSDDPVGVVGPVVHGCRDCNRTYSSSHHEICLFQLSHHQRRVYTMHKLLRRLMRHFYLLNPVPIVLHITTNGVLHRTMTVASTLPTSATASLAPIVFKKTAPPKSSCPNRSPHSPATVTGCRSARLAPTRPTAPATFTL